MKIKKLLATAGIAVVATLTLAACSSKESSEKGKQEVKMATVGTTAPFSYEVDGKLTGFDVELARAIFKDSSKYDFKIEKVAGDAQYPGLDADKFDFIGNNTSYTKKRDEKYLYSYPTASTPAVIATTKDSNIKSYDDLGGHSTQVLAGTTGSAQMEAYNKEHAGKPVAINYTSETITQILTHVNEGKYDFKVFDAPSVKTIIENQKLDNLKTIELKSDEQPYIYYVFTDDNKDLQTFVNKRIKELYEDGTVSTLAKKFLGGDYAPKEADLKVPGDDN